jgi:GNAT superfamily N-acetyltransferase
MATTAIGTINGRRGGAMGSPVQRLSDSARETYCQHLLGLSPEDKYLRFGSVLKPQAIIDYVAHIDMGKDVVFGIHDDALRLIGAAHVAFSNDEAELGISVLAGSRGVGHGTALFNRAVEHVRNRFHSRIYMHCLSENAAMMHIARRAGMDVVVEMGEADAYLALPPANPISLTREVMNERLAVFDYALKTHIDTMRRVGNAIRRPRGKK